MSERSARIVQGLLVILALIVGWRWWWTCDDAFISFRYAQRLTQGLGLSFNDGEWVEGYTNFLWTLWVALGKLLGLDEENWSNGAGLVSYAALVWALSRPQHGRYWPLAAVLLVSSRPMQIWATGGLETSANLALLGLGFFIALPAVGSASSRRNAVAGLVFAAAALTRPDSVLVAGVCGLAALWRESTPGGRWLARALQGLRSVWPMAAGFLLIWVPALIWRKLTYGDWVPNTYHAKSGSLAWWTQGLVYLKLVFVECPWFGLGLLLGWRVSGQGVPRAARARQRGAWVSALLFTVYVTKVGGGFMHCRLALPGMLFAFIALEAAVIDRVISTLPSMTQRWATLVVVGMVCLMWPPALDSAETVSGVVDERAHYDPARAQRLERDAARISPYVKDLNLRVAFIGGQARLVHRLGPPVAIEAETGLTDAWVARQKLRRRGRVGHEKRAPPDYLVRQRRTHMVFGAFAFTYLGLDEYIPRVGVNMSKRWAFLLHWDSKLVEALRRRGALVPPFEKRARELLANPKLIPASQRATTLTKIRRFWPEAPQASQ